MQWCDPSDDSPVIISPDKEIAGYVAKHGAMPGFGAAERMLMVETKSVINTLRARYPIREEAFLLPAFLGKRSLYTIEGSPDITILEGAFGAPAAVDALETAIAMGCRKLFVYGICGAVGDDVQIGDLIIPTRVLREDRCSVGYRQETGVGLNRTFNRQLKEPSLTQWRHANGMWILGKVCVR